VTDSGGIQEEASTLGVPVVVCRKTTERMEAVHAKMASLVGLEIESILNGMNWANQKANTETRQAQNIFGNGSASQRIADIVLSRITLDVPSMEIQKDIFPGTTLPKTAIAAKVSNNKSGVKNV